jgi:hypothetical protein
MMPGSAAAVLGRKASWQQAVQRLMAERRMTFQQATREIGKRGGNKSAQIQASIRARRAREEAMRLT